MPKKGEKCIPLTISEESTEHLNKLIDRTGMLQADVLRYAITAALRTLAEKDSVTLPIHFSVNGEGKKGK